MVGRLTVNSKQSAIPSPNPDIQRSYSGNFTNEHLQYLFNYIMKHDQRN